MGIKILVVCTGNICRSPTGEAVLQKLVTDRNLEKHFEIDSASTHSYHSGNPPDARSLKVAEKRGYDLSPIRARQVKEKDFRAYDLILAMDSSHLRFLNKIKPSSSKTRIVLFTEYSKRYFRQDVPDPYYGESREFHAVLDMIEEGADAVLLALHPD